MRWLTAAALATPLLLGGVLPVESSLEERWPAAGAWLMPVGEPYALGPSLPGGPSFRENRGVLRARGRVTHQGSDLANGRAGDTVRAVAHGIVLKAARSEGDGYGDHIVLAHRSRDGALHYSVYAHLQRGSMRVERGEVVAAGQPLGRVGQTGRASTPHLHFEVRECADPAAPWELAPVIEPLPFISQRLPTMREDPTWACRYLEWGERAALVPAGSHPDDALSRERWWRMLAHSAASPLQRVDDDAARLRDTLIALGVLPEDAAEAAPERASSWRELGRDVARLHDVGVRLPPGPTEPESLATACARWLGRRVPSDRPRDLAKLEDPPTLGLVCLLLADMAGSRAATALRESRDVDGPEPNRSKPKKQRKPRRR